MHVSSSHIRNACLAYRLVCGSRQFLLDRYLIMETSLDKGTQRKTTENELPSLTQCTA